MKLKNFVKSVLMIVMIGLTSCETRLLKKKEPLLIYQPSILSLEKGKPVLTKTGIYIPQVDEIWHSQKRYQELERDLYYK